MNWWDMVREAGDTFLAQHALLAAFAYLAVEESGVPIPVPGDFLMMAFGVHSREGVIVLWQVIAAMEAGTVLGSSLLYFLARYAGRGAVERYGPFIGISSEQLDRAERQLQRHGGAAVVLGRLLPGLRVLTAIACGIFRVPYRVFLPTGSGGPLLLLLIGLILIRRGLPLPLPRPALRAWHRARVGLLSGLLATGGALLTLDLIVIVAGDLAWRLPDSLPAVAAEQLSQALARDATGGLLWLAVPLVAGVGWGGLYAVWAESRRARDVNTVWLEVEVKLGGWVRGQLVLMLAIACMAGVGYTVLGLPDALLLAVMAGLFEIVPMVGPFLAFAPAVLVALTVDPTRALVVVGYALVIQQIESNIVAPRVMRRAVGVTPLTVLLGILIGSTLYGLPGAFVAVPVAGVVQVIFAHLLKAEDASQAAAHTDPQERVEQQGGRLPTPSKAPGAA